MCSYSFGSNSWSGRDGRNLNSNLPMGYREPTDAEVEAALSSVTFECPECGESTADSHAQHPDGRVFCSEACLNLLMWRESIERKAAVQCEIWRQYASQAEARRYRTVGRFQAAAILAVGGWLAAIMLAFGWGRW